jgi:NAD(P)-dependent dehydrogenase (short-subunit alcohol dehydrogenase family)
MTVVGGQHEPGAHVSCRPSDIDLHPRSSTVGALLKSRMPSPAQMSVRAATGRHEAAGQVGEVTAEPAANSTRAWEQVGSFASVTPIGPAGWPAEPAPAYVFLAFQESSYITGERLGVTGGMPMP